MAARVFGRRQKVTCCRFFPILKDNLCHPYYLGIDKVGADNICGNAVESGFVLSISRHRAPFSSKQECLFTCVKLVEGLTCTEEKTRCLYDSDINDTNTLSSENYLSLLCTPQFIEHYAFKVADLVYATYVNPFPISKLVLGAKTKEAFEWISATHNFTTGLVISVCQEQVIIQKGDVFLAPSSSFFKCNPCDLVVLDCEPLAKGVLTVTTEIVIAQVPAIAADNGATDDVHPTVDEHLSPVILTHFANRFPLFPQNDAILSKPEVNLRKRVSVTVVTDMSWWHLLFMDQPDQQYDVYNAICLSKKCAKHLQLYNGSFVEIQSGASAESAALSKPINDTAHVSEHKCPDERLADRDKRIVQVKVIDQRQVTDGEIGDEEVYMSTILAFNLQSRSSDLTCQMKQVFIKELQYAEIKNRTGTCSANWNIGIQVAVEVRIACVQSPLYNVRDDFKSILQKHFSTLRLIQVGDVLCVEEENNQDISKEFDCRKVVFFKVQKILPDLGAQTVFVADTKKCSLFQDGPVHSLLPVDMLSAVGHRTERPAAGLQSYVEQLVALLTPRLHHRLPDQQVPSVLLTGPAGCGKRSVVTATAAILHMQVYTVNCFYDVHGETSSAVESRLKHIMHNVCSYAPCILLLRNAHSLGREKGSHDDDQRVISSFRKHMATLALESPDWPVVVIATTSTEDSLSSDVHEAFLHQINIESPNEDERLQMLRELAHNARLQALHAFPSFHVDTAMQDLAQKTAGLVYGDLVELRDKACLAAYRRALALCGCERDGRAGPSVEVDLCLSGLKVEPPDWLVALDQLHTARADAMAAPKIPDVRWSDVGGLARVKDDILDTIQLPLRHPELFAAGLRRSGLLFYGPPGTGKTLLAKAVATECSLNFLSVKGPELINMYLGQSEENVREVFKKARSASPCVVFFDELDALAPNRGRSGDSGGVMDRVVSQLLAELDGLHKSCDVFVIGATNRPDLLDPALLRPGRFEKMLYLGVSETHEEQLQILNALTQKFSLGAQCSLQRVAERCPFNMTGADFYALCSDAALSAIKRSIAELEAGGAAEGPMTVVEDDFLGALRQLVPSVTPGELAKYTVLRQQLAPQQAQDVS